MSLAAFLLCAGYGQRLRPLTERIAKPALTFLGKSALEINKKKIEPLNPDRWLANTHHLPEQIESLAKSLGLEVLHEPEILGTGGCLYNASSILEKYDSFLVHNADLIHTIDLQGLLNRHLTSGALATLAGISHPHHNTLSVSTSGQLLGVHGYRNFKHQSGNQQLTFSGVAIYRREFLRFVGPGAEDIKPFWIAALDAGESIHVVDCSAAHWHDFGSPQGLWEAAKYVMDSNQEFSFNYPSTANGKPCVGNEAGQTDLPEGLQNVLIYEKIKSFQGVSKKNCILGSDFEWSIQV